MGGDGSGNFQRRFDHEEAIAMLRENVLNHAQIAIQVGCSRERIRQLAARHLSVTGREQEREREDRKMAARGKAASDHLFVTDAAEHGIQVDGLPTAMNSVSIGNISVAVRKASPRLKYCGGMAVNIKSPMISADYVAWLLPDGRWMIVPQSACPADTTMFSLHEHDGNVHPGLSYSKRHDWQSYIGRWDLLGGSMEILELVKRENILRGAEKYKEVLDRMESLEDGFAIPVKFEKNSQAQALQAYLFQRQNQGQGRRYEVRRIGAIVYISLAIEAPKQ